MALSNTITTILRDPYAHSKYRTEFRLDDENLYMLPSMRLCNLGAWSAQLDDDTGVYYLPLTGVASCIQSIALYLNGTLVDNNDDVAVSVALRNLRKSNAENQDIGRWTSMAGLGFDVGTYENPTNLCLTLSSKWYENAHVQGGVDHDAEGRLLEPELEDHLLVLRVDRHRVAHPAVPQDLLAALASFRPVLDDVEGQDGAELLDRKSTRLNPVTLESRMPSSA